MRARVRLHLHTLDCGGAGARAIPIAIYARDDGEKKGERCREHTSVVHKRGAIGFECKDSMSLAERSKKTWKEEKKKEWPCPATGKRERNKAWRGWTSSQGDIASCPIGACVRRWPTKANRFFLFCPCAWSVRKPANGTVPFFGVPEWVFLVLGRRDHVRARYPCCYWGNERVLFVGYVFNVVVVVVIVTICGTAIQR